MVKQRLFNWHVLPDPETTSPIVQQLVKMCPPSPYLPGSEHQLALSAKRWRRPYEHKGLDKLRDLPKRADRCPTTPRSARG